MEMAAVLQRRLRWHTVILRIPLYQNRQCEMFNIIKIQNIFIPLLRIECFLKRNRQVNKRLHCRPTDLHLLHNLFFCLEKKSLLQIPDLLLHIRADIFDHLPLYVGNRPILPGREPVKFHRRKSRIEIIISAITVFPASAEEIFHHLPLTLQNFPIHIRTVRLFTYMDGILQFFSASFQNQPCLPHEITDPRDLVKVDTARPFFYTTIVYSTTSDILIHHTVVLLSLPKPLLRERCTHGKIIELQHDLFHRRVPAARAEILHAVQKFLFARRISGLQHLFQRLLPDQPGLPLLGNPESRVQPNRMELIAQHKKTETVYRGNSRIVQQSSLFL